MGIGFMGVGRTLFLTGRLAQSSPRRTQGQPRGMWQR